MSRCIWSGSRRWMSARRSWRCASGCRRIGIGAGGLRRYRFDGLAQGFEESGAGVFGFAFAGRAQQVHAGVGEGRFEVAAVVVLVRDQCLSGSVSGQGGVGADVQLYLAFVGLDAGQPRPDRKTAQGAQQVQSQSPEVARMAGAGAVFGQPGQLRAACRLPRSAALDRRGIRDPYVVAEQAGVTAQHPDQPADRGRQLAQPLVVTGLLRQIREHGPQMCAGITQPAGLTGEPEQSLHHAQRHQLGVGEPGCDPDPWPPRQTRRFALQQIIHTHLKCGREGVQIGVHDEPPARRWVIVRKERPHPGAQLRITDADGHRVTAFATNTSRGQLADLELRHRRRARCEDRIHVAKDTGLSNLPLHDFAQNQIWCAIVALAVELTAWLQTLALAGHDARRWEPKRLLRLFYIAARLADHGRTRRLHLSGHAPWAELLAEMITRLQTLPAPG
jgi:hypothetical protein